MPRAKLISPITKESLGKRVAAYCRVSTNYADQKTSYATQIRVYQKMINENPDWTLVDIFADEGISGTRADKRPQFKRMIKDCSAGKIDIIITKSVSRFARNTVECLEYVRNLKAQGISVIFEEQNIDTMKCDSELYLVMYAGFAQSESESMSKNITWSMRKNFADGKVKFNYRNFLGYRKGADGEPEIVPEEAAVVERVFDMFLSGMPIRDICGKLQSENLTFTDKHFEFSKRMIQSMLQNEKYCGDCILQKTVTIDCITKERKPNQGEAPMYLVENNHPPIVSRGIFNRAQEELSRRNALSPKSGKTTMTASGKYSKYALTDVLVCGECGSRYRRCTWSKNGQKKVVWRCISRLDYGKKYCKNSLTIKESALHSAIVRAINRFNAEDRQTYIALMKATIDEAIGVNGNQDEINLLERRIEALNKRMITIVNDSVAEGEDIESHEDEFRAISDEIEQLRRRIGAVREAEARDDAGRDRIARIQETIDRRDMNSDVYDDSIVRQMIECVKVFQDKRIVVIFGGGVEIEEVVE
ncbi:MAG: recombinase family protein [Eubacteriales bacterium]